MEGAITSFAVEKLGELIISEAKLLSGVRGEVERLHTELTRMQGFLQKVDSRKERADPTVINYIAEIRGVAYDAEDIIETYILKVQSRREGRGVLNVLKRRASIFIEASYLHRVGMDIKALNSKITDIRKSAKTYGIDFNSHGEGSSSSYDKQIELRRTYSHNQDTDIVGLQKDTEKLVNHLVSSEKHVAIWGMGGLGKTTLAKKIYWDRVTRHHFDCFAWACVSQQCKPKDVLKALLIGLQSASKDESDRCGRMEINELTKQLYQLQEEKKCLVVLDDAWKPEDLQSIHAAFPPTTRSKIILTTRNKEVVSHIRTYIGQESILHELQLLTEEESLDLFWRKARSRNSSTAIWISG